MECFTTTRGAVPSEAVAARPSPAAVHRPRLARIAAFGGAILAALSVAAPASAWPMCGT